MQSVAETEAIDPVNLNEVRAIANDADKGPWKWCGCGKCGLIWSIPLDKIAIHADSHVDEMPVENRNANARFAAAARSFVPAMADEIERLTDVVLVEAYKIIADRDAEIEALKVERDQALTKLDVAGEVITEVRGVCKAAEDELTVDAVRRALREEKAAGKSDVLAHVLGGGSLSEMCK